MISSLADFDYESLNPFEITWNPSKEISDYDNGIDDDYIDNNGNQDTTGQPEININELENEIHILVNNKRLSTRNWQAAETLKSFGRSIPNLKIFCHYMYVEVYSANVCFQIRVHPFFPRNPLFWMKSLVGIKHQ